LLSPPVTFKKSNHSFPSKLTALARFYIPTYCKNSRSEAFTSSTYRATNQINSINLNNLLHIVTPPSYVIKHIFAFFIKCHKQSYYLTLCRLSNLRDVSDLEQIYKNYFNVQ